MSCGEETVSGSGGEVGRSRLRLLSDGELLQLEKPAQYLGGEKNSVVKDDAEVDVHFALAFPDTYEVGMSHLGIQILYDLVNRDPRAWAERVYMPLPDMEALLRQKNAPLCSLEAKRPVRRFDVLGFSLQYELCGTNILAMLDLSGLAFYAHERPDDAPLVIGGGPYCYHPDALAPFFDAFFLGDAEEFIPEMLEAVRQAKQSGKPYRPAVLELLRKVEGIYIPADYAPRFAEDGRLLAVESVGSPPTQKGAAALPVQGNGVGGAGGGGGTETPQIVRRLLPTMEGAPFPRRPVVPSIRIVHNRLSVEVMRGCVRGCRFCQAGYLYRPQRERSPEEILEMIEAALPETGFEEVSLLSLSTADYCSVVPLLKSLMDRYGDGDQLAISFPSTRVDALTPEVLEQVQRGRRTSFTVAPEGGSQRLRDVINKGVSDEQILETCGNVFRMGWTGIKLYFMLGLPTETDDDLMGIVDLARRIKALPGASGKDITVSVSTHVPKPHTPFQWAEQITPEETIRRQRLLANGLRKTGVNFRYHEHFSSFLEGIFCRAGREIAPVVVRAYELGCRLDAWKEHLSEEKWLQAFMDCNINPRYYLRERAPEEALPWDHLSCGIPKSYFLKEYQRAMRDRTTPDCLTASCSICGACDYDERKNILWPRHEAEVRYDAKKGLKAADAIADAALTPVLRVRVRYSKHGSFCFLGHLELVQVFHRAIRRAALPVCYTQGFHPMPRIAFGPPLQLGVSSNADYFDLFLSSEITIDELLSCLNSHLPDELRGVSAWNVPLNASSLQESIRAMRYRVRWIGEPTGTAANALATIPASHAELEALDALSIFRDPNEQKKGGGNKRKNRKAYTFALRDYVSEPLVDAKGDFEFTLRTDPTCACPNALEVVLAVSGLKIGDYFIEKTDAVFAPEA